MQHGQKVHKQPLGLLEKLEIKFKYTRWPYLLWICRTYNILQSDIAKKLLKQKVENINKVKPDFISTGNIGYNANNKWNQNSNSSYR